MKRTAGVVGSGAFAQLVLLASVLVGGSGTPIETLSYDDFRALSPDSRIEAFDRLSPEGKARLFRAHVEAWRNANAGRLTKEQFSFITARVVPFITADLYRRPLDETNVKAVKDIEDGARQLFSPRDISAAFHLVGIH